MSEHRSGRSHRSRSRSELVAILAATLLALALLAGGWSATHLVWSLEDNAREGVYLTNVVTRIESLMSKANDVESEHRAYLENGDPARLKSFTEAAAGLRAEYDELMKLTSADQRLQVDLQAAKAHADKTLDSMRGAIEYQRSGQGTNAMAVVAQGGSIAGAVKESIVPVYKSFQLALRNSQNRPRDAATEAGQWLLVTWVLAMLAGVTVAFVAIREARSSGRLHRRLRHESIYDSLTGLPNNVYLEEWLARSLSRATRSGTRVGVVYVDVNNFKQVNHALGHTEGDKVLLEIAEKLGSITRSSDFVARIRNDSFAIVMSDVRDQQQLESAMRRFGTLAVTRAGIAIKTSAGAALFPEDAETADNLLRLSRAAMYRNRSARRAA